MRGRTALMHACAAPFHQNHPEVVQILLAKGADVNAKDKRGVKVLDYARSWEIQELLIKAGADPRTEKGWMKYHLPLPEPLP